MIYNKEQEIVNASSPSRLVHINSTSHSHHDTRYKHHLNGEINNNKSLDNNQQDDIELIVSCCFYLFISTFIMIYFLSQPNYLYLSSHTKKKNS